MTDLKFARQPWVVGQQTPWTGVTKPAKNAKRSVLDLIHKVNKIEENTAFFRKEEYVTEPKKSLRILHEKYAQSLRNEKRLRILLTWRGLTKLAKQSRHLSERIRNLKQQFTLKLILMEWYSVAVKQPRIMLSAHKRLQRRAHHSLSFISAQYGVYAHYWLRVLLLSWKRLLFDAPGGFLLHREVRLRRQQNFGNALATSTKLLTRSYEVEDKECQCSFRSREETLYKEKVEEFKAVEEKNKEEREQKTRKQEILVEHLTKLKSDYEALHKAFKREKQISADAQKQVERIQSLQTLKEYTKGDMGRMATEMKELRERAMAFPQSFTCPVVATINNIHQIELRNMENTEKIIAPVSHRISSCKLEGDCLLVYENEGVLIRFTSERSSNLCIVSSMLARMIEERDEFMTISINVNHKQSKDSQCQIEIDRMHGDLAAAKQKVDILLETARGDVEKKSIEALMAEEKPNRVGQNTPSLLLESQHTSLDNNRKVSLDQQVSSLDRKASLDQQVSSFDRKVSLDQQVSSFDRKVSLDQQVSSLDRKVSLDQQVLSFDRKVSLDQQVSSFDRKVSLDQQVSSFDRKVSLDQQVSSFDRKVSLDQQVSSFDRKVSLDQQVSSLDNNRKVSLDQQVSSLDNNRKVSLDQQVSSFDRKVSLDQQVSSFDRKVSLDQQVSSLDNNRKVSLDQQVSSFDRKVSLDQQVSSFDRKVSLDQQVMLMGEIQSSMSKQKEIEEHEHDQQEEMMTELFSRLQTNHIVSEANIGLIEEI